MARDPLEYINWLPETTCVIVNNTAHGLPSIIQRVQKNAKKSLFESDLKLASISALQALRKGPVMIIAYLDVTGQVIEELFGLRQSVIGAPLLLITEHAKFDDLSTERAAICDATIKEPRDTFHLATGMISAHSNFRELLKRRLEETRPRL